MNRCLPILVLTAATLGPADVLHAEDASLVRDLKATIALQGQPCDAIVSSKRNADSDYEVLCKDGHRYHVFVNAQERVVVEKR
jgi:hypothetical protein